MNHNPRHPHSLTARSTEQSAEQSTEQSAEQGADAWVVIGGIAGCLSVAVAIIGLRRSHAAARSENRVPDTPTVDTELPLAVLDPQHSRVALYPDLQLPSPVLFVPRIETTAAAAAAAATWPPYKRPYT